jgi:hypothetical protein
LAQAAGLAGDPGFAGGTGLAGSSGNFRVVFGSYPRHVMHMTSNSTHRFCVAPMMEWTDRHCRYFLRLISRRTFLYTEMVTADAVLYGNRERVLGFSPEETPVGLQLGGRSVRTTAMTRSI